MSEHRAMRFNLLLLIAPAALIALACWGLTQRLAQPYPMHFWEAGMLADSYRAMVGLPVYEEPTAGHATHMYGPLATYAPAAMFSWFGVSFYPARLMSLLGFVGAGGLLIYFVRPTGVVHGAVLAAASMAAIGAVTHDFLEPRPDGVSLFFSVAAMLLFFVAVQKDHWLALLAGLSCMLVGVFFKQPSAMVCVMPGCAMLFQQSPWSWNRRQWIMVAAPPITIVAALATTAFAFPQVFHYLVTTPAQYSIRLEEVLRWAWRFPLSIPLLWLAYCYRYYAPADDSTERLFAAKQAWLSAALLVAVPAGVLAAAKQGGMANSLAPAYFVAAAMFLHWSRPLEIRWRTASRDLTPLTAITLVLLCVGFLSPRFGSVRSDVTFATQEYALALRFIEQADGSTACPQDPSLLALAEHRPGRSLIMEYDQAGWPIEMPARFFSDLGGADYAITIGKDNDWRSWPLTSEQRDQRLQTAGFKPLPLPQFEGSVYQVWSRERLRP